MGVCKAGSIEVPRGTPRGTGWGNYPLLGPLSCSVWTLTSVSRGCWRLPPQGRGWGLVSRGETRCPQAPSTALKSVPSLRCQRVRGLERARCAVCTWPLREHGGLLPLPLRPGLRGCSRPPTLHPRGVVVGAQYGQLPGTGGPSPQGRAWRGAFAARKTLAGARQEEVIQPLSGSHGSLAQALVASLSSPPCCMPLLGSKTTKSML